MKKFFSFILLLLVMSACNNGTEKEVDSKDSIPDIVERQPEFKRDSMALTEEEIKDDSVFTDGSRPTSWANAGIKDPVAFKKFLRRFQIWVDNGMKDNVASAIAFPLINPPVENRNAFLSGYDTYINSKVKAALKNQNFSQIFRNVQGAMIGNGELWFTQKDNEFVVTGINYK